MDRFELQVIGDIERVARAIYKENKSRPLGKWAEVLMALEAAQHSVQADGVQTLFCGECGKGSVMNHKESCSKRRR